MSYTKDKKQVERIFLASVHILYNIDGNQTVRLIAIFNLYQGHNIINNGPTDFKFTITCFHENDTKSI